MIKTEKVAPEVALVKVKLLSSLRRQAACPERSRWSNRLVLNEASKQIAKLASARHGLNRNQSRELKQVILAVLEHLTGVSPSPAPPHDTAELPKEIESIAL